MSTMIAPHLQEMIDCLVDKHGKDREKTTRLILCLDAIFAQEKGVVVRKGTSEEKVYTGWSDWVTAYQTTN